MEYILVMFMWRIVGLFSIFSIPQLMVIYHKLFRLRNSLCRQHKLLATFFCMIHVLITWKMFYLRAYTGLSYHRCLR